MNPVVIYLFNNLSLIVITAVALFCYSFIYLKQNFILLPAI